MMFVILNTLKLDAFPYRGVYPHPESHTTSTEQPGSKGGMYPYIQIAHLYRADSIIVTFVQVVMVVVQEECFFSSCLSDHCVLRRHAGAETQRW